jgi:hypothetical protein
VSADRGAAWDVRCADVRERAQEAFLIGSHGTPSGVWFADVTAEDVQRDATIILALLDVAEKARQFLDTGRGDLDGALEAFTYMARA